MEQLSAFIRLPLFQIVTLGGRRTEEASAPE
jgi:hypothetical protein